MLALYHKHGGQRGYSGHVLNLPQNTQQFLNQLPAKVNTLPILIVRRHGANSSYVVLKVRRQRVLSALQWLKQNNPFYSDIEIDLFLPTDGTPDDILTLEISEEDEQVIVNEGPQTVQLEDPPFPCDSTSFLPQAQQVQT